MTYGEKIKAMRVAAGLTQQQLAEACGFESAGGYKAVQHWEHDRNLPPIDKLRAMAEALKVTLDDVVP